MFFLKKFLPVMLSLQLIMVDGAVMAGTNSSQQIKAQVLLLYGDANQDFLSYLQYLKQQHQLENEHLFLAGQLQPALRFIQKQLFASLDDKARQKAKNLQLYVIPSKMINAFAIGKSSEGPGFIVISTGLISYLLELSYKYTFLRKRNLSMAHFSQKIQLDIEDIAQRAVRGDMPSSSTLRHMLGDPKTGQVLLSMLTPVIAHEMAHYYGGHLKSSTTSSYQVQQKEIDADSLALSNLQKHADKNNFWEGGTLYMYLFFAALEKTSSNKVPEWLRTHPYAISRLRLALPKIGDDNFQLRNDPFQLQNMK